MALLFAFLMLAAFLTASAANMVAELSNSIEALFAKSRVPHFVQMHAGEVDRRQITNFAADNRFVRDSQLVEMVNIHGADILLNGDPLTEKASIMDHYFVKQNKAFDVLLNMNSTPVHVNQGEIAIPIYYKQQKNIKLGDNIKIAGLSLTVKDFVRDAQMNPSIIHSKRFVISEADFNRLKQEKAGDLEYLVEFRLKDLNDLSAFRKDYVAAEMPAKGPSVDYPLFRTLNALTDGMVAAVLILISLLLGIIAMLCIRFIILASMEEDTREIGVMKAIGIRQHAITKIYLLKYMVLAVAASLSGYAASLLLGKYFTGNLLLYMGKAPMPLLLRLVPVAAVGLTCLLIVLFCLYILRRLSRMSAVEAMRSAETGQRPGRASKLPLYKSKLLPVSVFLGIRDAITRFGMYLLLCTVLFIAAFMAIVPVHFLNTIQSPDFIRYMGVEKSDIRMDLQEMADAEKFNHVVRTLERDPDVAQFAAHSTSRLRVLVAEGIWEPLTIETGDFSKFPLSYVKGKAPSRKNEIALSYLNSEDLEKEVGDLLRLKVGKQEEQMIVSGIYQDITNGGRTAKAVLDHNKGDILRYQISLDVKPGIDIAKKTAAYAERFPFAKVTGLQGYVTQTFQNTIDQVRLFTMIAMVIAASIAALIASLFLKMVLAKDASQIGIMKGMGLSVRSIRLHYLTSMLATSVLGIALGTAAASLLGEMLAGMFLSFMGASDINFVIVPVHAYLLCPLALLIAVTGAALAGMDPIKKNTVMELGK